MEYSRIPSHTKSTGLRYVVFAASEKYILMDARLTIIHTKAKITVANDQKCKLSIYASYMKGRNSKVFKYAKIPRTTA